MGSLNPLWDIMDKRGMLPDDWPCLRCGRKLNADGNHPAELYAGSWNGLCYRCTSAGPYVESVAVFDGCRKLNYPPHLPSWRRNREHYYGYPGCEHCRGWGVAGRGTSVGGSSYPEYCRACMDRYSDHPLRKWDSGWTELIMRAAQSRFEVRLDQEAGTPAKASKKRREAARETVPDDARQRIRKEVMADYERVRDRHSAHAKRLRLGEWREPTEDELREKR